MTHSFTETGRTYYELYGGIDGLSNNAFKTLFNITFISDEDAGAVFIDYGLITNPAEQEGKVAVTAGRYFVGVATNGTSALTT